MTKKPNDHNLRSHFGHQPRRDGTAPSSIGGEGGGSVAIMTDVAQRVGTLIANRTGYPLEKLRDETDLLRDVRIDGLDAWELLEAICDEFGIDGRSIIVDRHFGPEVGFNPVALLLPSWWVWHRNRIPVTVGILVQAAVSKRWPIKYESDNT